MLWIAVGVGAAYYASRWWRRQRDRYGADALAEKASQGVRDVMELARLSVEEGRRAAAEKEAELRGEYGHPAEERESPPPPR
ncbi:MAG: hypothetical protein ACRDHB_03710 [Actinomycetota bacterium]